MALGTYGRLLISVAAAALALALLWPHWERETGERHHYVLQAQALLAGRLDIPARPLPPAGAAAAEANGGVAVPLEDVALVNGRAYCIFPPAPAVLLLPVVAVWGTATKASVVVLGLTLLNGVLLARLARRLDGAARVPWLLAAFLVGTPYAAAFARAYEPWQLAHVLAVTAQVGALAELLGRRRGWVLGLCLAGAVLSRQLSVYFAMFALWQLWLAPRRWRDLAVCGGVLALALAAYLWMNHARFGSPFDTGYGRIELAGFLRERVATYGTFHVAYLPFNLTYMFLQGFHIEFAGTRTLAPVGLDPFGTSLTCASPFLLAAFWARRAARGSAADAPPPLDIRAAWLAVGATLLHAALYYNNGWQQEHGQRFALDCLPLLFGLFVLGAARLRARWVDLLMGYAIALGVAAFILLPRASAWLGRL